MILKGKITQYVKCNDIYIYVRFHKCKICYRFWWKRTEHFVHLLPKWHNITIFSEN